MGIQTSNFLDYQDRDKQKWVIWSCFITTNVFVFFKVHMCESELVLDRFLFILSPLADRRSRARSLHHCSSYQAQGSVCTRVCVHMCVDSVCLCDKMTFQPVRRHVLTCPQPKTQSVKFPWPQLHAVQKCKHMNTFSFCAASYFLAFVSCWSIFFLFILFSKLLYSSVFTFKKKRAMRRAAGVLMSTE